MIPSINTGDHTAWSTEQIDRLLSLLEREEQNEKKRLEQEDRRLEQKAQELELEKRKLEMKEKK